MRAFGGDTSSPARDAPDPCAVVAIYRDATVAKHRLFAWMYSPTLPDHQLIAVTRDDDTTFGILHNRFHEVWALRLGTWLGVGNDPRYTPSSTFETFPFPDGLTPNRPSRPLCRRSLRYGHRLKRRRTFSLARDRWLNPAELVLTVPEAVPGFPDRIVPKDDAAATTLRGRTLTGPL